MSTALQTDVLDILRGVECDGCVVRITQALDRAVYQKVAKVLEALGGKWNRKAQCTVFPEDAAPLISDAVATGRYVDAKKEFQFYETPAELVDRILELVGVRLDGLTVLEPSAGKGAIASMATDRGAVVDCIELDPSKCFALANLRKFRKIIECDFLKHEGEELYDAVLMNPPFCRSQDMKHVRHAWNFVKPGGSLVAVMSPGWTFRSDAIAEDFKAWVHSVDGEWTANPEGSFRASGTMVNTGLLFVTREK